MRAYKLFRRRKDGTLGPLFINAGQRIPLGEWLPAEDKPTKGFAHRPGWHATLLPDAPHLKMTEGRVWAEVELWGPITRFGRPASQGGAWLLCTGALKVIKVLEGYSHE